MQPPEYLTTLVKTYNPNQYERLLERRMRDAFAFLIFTILVSVVVFIATAIPAMMHDIGTLQTRASEVDAFMLDANVEATHPVVLLERPRVVLDLTQNTTRNGHVTLTSEGILYPAWGVFGTRSASWSEIRDLHQPTATRDRMLFGAALFLMPSIIFWWFIVGILLLTVAAFIIALIGWAAPRALGHSITSREIVQLIAFTLPSALIFSLGLSPLGVTALTWGGCGLSVVLFFTGVAMMSELQQTKPAERKEKSRKA